MASARSPRHFTEVPSDEPGRNCGAQDLDGAFQVPGQDEQHHRPHQQAGYQGKYENILGHGAYPRRRLSRMFLGRRLVDIPIVAARVVAFGLIKV